LEVTKELLFLDLKKGLVSTKAGYRELWEFFRSLPKGLQAQEELILKSLD